MVHGAKGNCGADSLEGALSALVRIMLHRPYAAYADDGIYDDVTAVIPRNIGNSFSDDTDLASA